MSTQAQARPIDQEKLNALLGQAITTPEALVDDVEPKRCKLSHRSSVDTSKPAIRGRGKTGHRAGAQAERVVA